MQQKGGRRAPQETHRINRSILAKEVRVIGDDGKQLGVMPTHIACRIAEEKGLDLVEINPKIKPPVCKIIDHGKFKYEEAKKKRASKRKQAVVVVKEIKLRPKTDTHDLDVKVRQILRFLSEGNKARLVIVFRGREIIHPEMGQAMLQKCLLELGEYAIVEQMPFMEGRRMTMLVAPKPGVTIPAQKKGGPIAEGLSKVKPLVRAKPVVVSEPDEDEDEFEDDLDDDESFDETDEEMEDLPASRQA